MVMCLFRTHFFSLPPAERWWNPMPEPAMLDYFYGDEAEQYTFYRIPKVLFGCLTAVFPRSFRLP